MANIFKRFLGPLFLFSLVVSTSWGSEISPYFGKWKVEKIENVQDSKIDESSKEALNSIVEIERDRMKVWFAELSPVSYKYLKNAVSSKEGDISEVERYLSLYYDVLTDRKEVPVIKVVFNGAVYFYLEILSEDKLLFMVDRDVFYLSRL